MLVLQHSAFQASLLPRPATLLDYVDDALCVAVRVDHCMLQTKPFDAGCLFACYAALSQRSTSADNFATHSHDPYASASASSWHSAWHVRSCLKTLNHWGHKAIPATSQCCLSRSPMPAPQSGGAYVAGAIAVHGAVLSDQLHAWRVARARSRASRKVSGAQE